MQECQHIKTNALRCHSPALRNHSHCYYHGPTRPLARPKPNSVVLPEVVDAASFQIAISQLLVALAANQITDRRASTLLYGLGIARTTLDRY